MNIRRKLVKRRLLLRSIAGGMALTISGLAVAADPFPSRPIKIVVPYAPGGASDMLGRAVAETMTRSFGQPAIVENKGGASGTTGSDVVSRSPADGYTLVMGTSASHSVNTVVFPKTYDPLTAFSPVALVTRVPNVIFVSPSFPAQNMQELVAYLKAHPQTPIGVGGPATSGRFAAELLMAKLNVTLTVVPYVSSAPVVAEVRAGQITLGITDTQTATAMIRSGDLRALAVTSRQRTHSLPDVPTVAETVSPGFEAVAWNALFAPPGTPPAVVAMLNAAVRKTFESAEARRRFEAAGQEIAVSTPDELRAFMREDIARWKGVAATNKLAF
jgi:tripartite-type tricarboxylate transporter receptor subunit TctC